MHCHLTRRYGEFRSVERCPRHNGSPGGSLATLTVTKACVDLASRNLEANVAAIAAACIDMVTHVALLRESLSVLDDLEVSQNYPEHVVFIGGRPVYRYIGRKSESRIVGHIQLPRLANCRCDEIENIVEPNGFRRRACNLCRVGL